MKKFTISLLAMFFMAGGLLAQATQDTIAAWVFPANSADSLVDVAIETNVNRFLSCEYGTYGQPTYYALTIDYATEGAAGGTDKCAKTVGWQDGADSIYWMVKFRTPEYKNLKVYSKQKSESDTPGPRDFKIQYKMPGGSSPWNDLATIVCTDDWANGMVDGISLPEECENVTSNISLRWIVTSNLDINGNPIDPAGSSLIDDIVITGEQITSIGDHQTNQKMFLYPNPSNGTFTIQNLYDVARIEIVDPRGRVIISKVTHGAHNLMINDLKPGIYFVNAYGRDDHYQTTIKQVVQ